MSEETLREWVTSSDYIEVVRLEDGSVVCRVAVTDPAETLDVGPVELDERGLTNLIRDLLHAEALMREARPIRGISPIEHLVRTELNK